MEKVVAILMLVSFFGGLYWVAKQIKPTDAEKQASGS